MNAGCALMAEVVTFQDFLQRIVSREAQAFIGRRVRGVLRSVSPRGTQSRRSVWARTAR